MYQCFWFTMANMFEVEAVFFDAAGTLFEVRGTVGGIYSAIARRYGADTDPEELDRAFRRVFRAKSEQTLICTAEATLAQEKHWWFQIVESVFDSRMAPDDLSDYFDEVFEYFRTADAWRLYPDTLPCLECLQGLGYRLGIISNFDSRLIDLLTNLGIRRFFEDVTISWHAGGAKPDPRIFLKGTDAMGIPPSRAVLVGDSVEEDFQGACRAGLQAILLDREGKYCDNTSIPRVRSLAELCRMFPKRQPPEGR